MPFASRAPSASPTTLTATDPNTYASDTRGDGASGFFLKDALARRPQATSVTRLIELHPRVANPPLVRRLATITARERNVLCRVACGLTNNKIATDLHLAEPQPRTHLERAYATTAVRDTARQVVFAYEAGLVRAGQSARWARPRTLARPHTRRGSRSPGHGVFARGGASDHLLAPKRRHVAHLHHRSTRRRANEPRQVLLGRTCRST